MSDSARAVVQQLESVVSRVAGSPGKEKLSLDLQKRFAPLIKRLQAMDLNSDAVETLQEFFSACNEGDAARADRALLKLTQTFGQAVGSAVVMGLKKVKAEFRQ